jgi:ribonuclease Y
MALATDPNTTSFLTFLAGSVLAYIFLKWRATAEKVILEERLKNEIELARREASLETSELQLKAEATQREAGRLLALAQTEAETVANLKAANEKERDFLQKEILRLSTLKPDEAKKLAFESLQKNYESEARRLREENLNRPEQETEEEARRILITTMQRVDDNHDARCDRSFCFNSQ